MSSISQNWMVFFRRLPSLFLGLFLFAVGIVMTLNADLGMGPWGVLQVGLAENTALTFGQVSQIIGLVVLVIGWALGFPPGFATLMNMYFIGLFIDLLMVGNIIPRSGSMLGQLALLLGGIGVLGGASFLYLNPKLGAGPRDGLMMGLVQKLNRPVSRVRAGIELTVLIIGYFLGGPIGLGTIISALTVGYAIQIAFKIGNYDSNAKHMNLYTLLNALRDQEVKM